MQKILCIGEALVDMVCTDTGMPLESGTRFVKKAGGAPLNAAAAVSSLGGKVDLLAKVGADPFGDFLLNTLKSHKVGTGLVSRHPVRFTTLAFVSLLGNGERDFYFNRGADAFLEPADVHQVGLTSYGMVHFGSATAFLPGPLQKAYSTLLSLAVEQGKFISFDPNFRQLLFSNNRESFIKQSRKFIRAAQFVKMSEEEALMISKEKELGQAAKKLSSLSSGIIAITLGSNGSLIGTKGEFIQAPTIKVKSIDSTGAGDAFMGAMLYQLARKKQMSVEKLKRADLSQMAAIANKAGALACTQYGALEAFGRLNEIFS